MRHPEGSGLYIKRFFPINTGSPSHLFNLAFAAFASNHFAAFARKKAFHAKAAKSKKNANSAKEKVHQ